MDTTSLLLLIGATCIAVVFALRLALRRQRRHHAATQRQRRAVQAPASPGRGPADEGAGRLRTLHFAARRAGYGLSAPKAVDAAAAWFAPTEFQSTWPSIMNDGLSFATSTSPVPLDGR